MIMNVNKERKIKNPFPIFPIVNTRNLFISLPNTPPNIEGDVKNPKNKEIHIIAISPSKKPFFTENNSLKQIKI